jgi:hypothetical protein
MKKYIKDETHSERGIALVSALLAMTMLLALGLAVVFSATTDITTTKIQRVGEQAFFASDAGIGIARRALAQAFEEEINKVREGKSTFYKNDPPPAAGRFPAVQVIPPPDGTWNLPFYQRVRDRAVELTSIAVRAQRLDEINGTKFTVKFSPLSGSLMLQETDAHNAVEVAVLRYSIQVTGETSGGGSSTVHETGRLSTDTTLAAVGGPTNRSFKFSGFGAFFDYGDTQPSAPLASGTFSGPVHTNTHFAFLSNRSVSFRNIVSQVENKIRYDNTSSTTPNRAIPTKNITGITLASDGYQTTDPVPLPENVFSQEYAVINGTGITDTKSDGSPLDPPAIIPNDSHGHPVAVFDSSGRVTVNVLAANLRNASGNAPTVSSNAIPPGVYVSSGDGSNITGAGIYVQGNVTDMQLLADTNGDQVYVIKQTISGNTKTTTIRTSYTNNRTTITSGSSSTTFAGVFTDKSDPSNIKPGVSLFVRGNIDGLRGGKTSSTNRPAIASKTRLTITAEQDITVIGDLKYADPVANSDGTSVSNIDSVQNVFGIFTNDGNLKLAPNSTYLSGPGLGLEMNAAVITFNQNTANDGGDIDGSIVYTGSSTPGTNDRWRLVGSRVQSKINNIGYNFRDIFFDLRFSGGTFSPPFFPGTSYKLGRPAIASSVQITGVNEPVPTAMSWFRDSN